MLTAERLLWSNVVARSMLIRLGWLSALGHYAPRFLPSRIFVAPIRANAQISVDRVSGAPGQIFSAARRKRSRSASESFVVTAIVRVAIA